MEEGRCGGIFFSYAGLILTYSRPLSGEQREEGQGEDRQVLLGALAGGLVWVGELLTLTLKEGSSQAPHTGLEALSGLGLS